jgi:hypothetical protein
MSDTVHSLSTSGLSPKKQIQCWSEALTDLCGQFDIDPLKASSLEARVNYTTVSKLKLCQIEVSQHRIAHTVSRAKSSEHPYVKILFQTHGTSYFEQEGRRFELMPGDCLAYDVSCPHTIISPALTRHEVVIVPKALLQERGFHMAKMSACKLSARTGTGRIAHDFVHAAFEQAAKLSPNNAVVVADSLIDLLLLPLREADAAFDRGGPEACYSRPGSSANICGILTCASTRLPHWPHQALSAYAVQRQGMTVSDYIWQARLQNCRHELETHAGRRSPMLHFRGALSSHISAGSSAHFGIVPSSIHKAQHGSPSPDVS